MIPREDVIDCVRPANHHGFVGHRLGNDSHRRLRLSSRRLNDKQVALKRMHDDGVIITTCESILFELLKVAGTEEFKAISQLVKGKDTIYSSTGGIISESFQRVRRQKEKGKYITGTVVKTLKDSKRMTKKELEKFDALKDEDIDYRDIPPTDEEFWKNARVIKPARKEAISLKLDPDILEWYKARERVIRR